MARDRTPPLWSWEVVRDVPATKDHPRYIEEITYYRGRPHSINRQYIIKPDSGWRRNGSSWPTTGRALNTPSKWANRLLLCFIVAFWVIVHTLTEV
jgi:hypothetical protein